MESIYSESDVTTSGLSWGEWKFALPEERVLEKITSVCLPTLEDPEEERWANLFSIVNKPSKINDSLIAGNTTSINTVQMETSNSRDMESQLITEEKTVNIEDFSSLVVDTCTRLVPKLKAERSAVQNELEPVVTSLSNIDEKALKSVMEKSWSQLQSDESKLSFCVLFTSTASMCSSLCKYILLPWLNVTHISKLELLSSILSREGDIVCVQLLAPLLQKEDSPWIEDLPGVEELMSAMTVQHWTVLLKALLGNLKELEEWQLRVLAVVVKNAEPSCQELKLLVQFLTSSSALFDQSRDFGALVAAVAGSMTRDSSTLVPQLKAIVNNFKGSLKVMKLKTLKVIADMSE